MYDGFGDPPWLLSPAAVGEMARGLCGMDLDGILTHLPTSAADEPAAGGFGRGFRGDVREHLTQTFAPQRFAVLREF